MYKFIYITTLRHRFNDSIPFDIKYTIKQFCARVKNITSANNCVSEYSYELIEDLKKIGKTQWER